MGKDTGKRKVLMTASVWQHIRNFHLPYLQEFQRIGWETHVACAEIQDNSPYIDRAISLPLKKQMGSMSNFSAARLLRQEINREQYDLIITHTSLASFFTRLAVKELKERPKLINVMHGYLFDDETRLPKREMLRLAEEITASDTDLLLTMNKWDFDLAQRYHLGKKIEMIPGMGVDYSRLDQSEQQDGILLRKQLRIPDNAFVMIYAAEFSARKSQQVLIEAMRYLPDRVRLVLPGEGELLERCRMIAEDYGVSERVLFPGQVSEIARWYRLADAAVSASRSEGLPFNILEAMHMGLPVVASAVKGHFDLIREGETGFLYPYGEAKACAEMVQCMMDDEAGFYRMKMQAKESVSSYGITEVFPIVMGYYLSFSK